MTTLREAAQQALEALEEFGTHYEHCPRYPTWARPELQPPCNCGLDSNVAALRAALAQQEQDQMLECAYKSACDIVEEQDKKLAELEAVNAELLEALVSFTKSGYIKKQHPKRYAAAVAAIAKAEGEQK